MNKFTYREIFNLLRSIYKELRKMDLSDDPEIQTWREIVYRSKEGFGVVFRYWPLQASAFQDAGNDEWGGDEE